ncbi:MAG: polyhydroxyalkanoic acid system family protein [Deltaproteobacteria bacterium]|nr:polyhydroxyalkanoic acid system family protein [Deltaproteobacteria bacterium]
MGVKTYRYPHKLGMEEALKRAAPVADSLARKYMMKREDTPEGFHLTGKGTDAKVVVADDYVELTVELGFLIEKLARDTLDRELDYKVPKALA